MSSGHRILHLDDIATIRFEDDAQPDWKPVRHELGVQAFGTNAFVADREGEVVIEEHDELPDADDDAGHEELYLVLAGAARFRIGGEETDVRTGGIVHIDDPALVRSAVALEPGTVVFAVGASPGEAFTPSPWEERFLERRDRKA
jgi:quercetin dioxygenase-like cupin family protein